MWIGHCHLCIAGQGIAALSNSAQSWKLMQLLLAVWIYTGRRLNQYNKDKFFYLNFYFKKFFFSNYKFTSWQRDVFLLPFSCISMLLESLLKIKYWNKKSSSLYWYIRHRLYVSPSRTLEKNYLNIFECDRLVDGGVYLYVI